MNSKFPKVIGAAILSADGKAGLAQDAGILLGSAALRNRFQSLLATTDLLLWDGKQEIDCLALFDDSLRARRTRAGLSEKPLLASTAGSKAAIAEPDLVLLAAREKTPANLPNRTEVVRVGSPALLWKVIVGWLCSRWKIRSIVCWGGGDLMQSLLSSGVVSELCIGICPVILGGRDAPTLADGEGWDVLTSAPLFRLQQKITVGTEVFLRYAVSARLAKSQSKSESRFR